MKLKIALIRGTFLNRYEMQSYEPLVDTYDITAFGSMRPFHDRFAFPVKKLWSPMDLPNFPYKMPILNRLTMDAQYLWGLEKKLTGFAIAHTAETYYHYTSQALKAKRDGHVQAVVVTILETIPHNNEGIWGRKRMKEVARHEVDHFIAVSNLSKQALIQEGTDPEKITIIPYGIDTKRFTEGKKVKESKDLNILFVGRLEKEKGVQDVLETFIRVVKLEPNITLTIVGSGSLRTILENRAREAQVSAKVSFMTSTYDDMPKIYQNADIFIAPSYRTATWEEQYNIALLEAQAAGLPIITTKSGAIPENVGDSAILVAPHDVRALARELTQLVTHSSLRWTLGVNARRRAVTVHDIQLIRKKIDAVYRLVLSNVKVKTK